MSALGTTVVQGQTTEVKAAIGGHATAAVDTSANATQGMELLPPAPVQPIVADSEAQAGDYIHACLARIADTKRVRVLRR